MLPVHRRPRRAKLLYVIVKAVPELTDLVHEVFVVVGAEAENVNAEYSQLAVFGPPTRELLVAVGEQETDVTLLGTFQSLMILKASSSCS